MAPTPLEPVPASAVRVTGGFWGERIDRAAAVTVPHCFERCEATGRLRNFDRAAGARPDAHEGRVYDDSDVYKTLEGAAWALGRTGDARLAAAVDGAIGRIARAAAADGYLNTWHQTTPGAVPWSDVRWKHELYCVGHLLEAGLAHAEARGDERLLAVALAAVDHVAARFGPHGRREPPGHPEIELALLRLAAARGRPGAIDLARFLLEQRGRTEGREAFGDLCQDHLPLRDQREVAGHAVRATYLFSAVADLVRLTGDRTWLPALDALWRDVVERRLYVTGGIGSSAANEGFTAPFDLPNEEAYAETCAAIGLALWAWRLALLYADARYADALERAIHNGVLAGLSASGDRFFYVNPLASDGRHARRPFFDCACCPTNLARFLPALGGLAYAVGEGVLHVNLFLPGRVETAGVGLDVETEIPWQGAAVFRVNRASPAPLELRVRVPGWAASARLAVNGRDVGGEPLRGYLGVRRTWRPGDEVTFEIPLEVARERSDRRVAANRGRVAIRRGPIVYCAEGADRGDGRLDPVRVPPDLAFEAVPLAGVPGGVLALRGGDGKDALTLVPYAAWGNRAPGPMAVWLPERG